MITFREFLHQKAQEERESQRRERREEWTAAVDRLMKQLRAWLEQSDPEKVLELIPLEFDKAEQGLGLYRVPGLRISAGEASAQVVPVGRNVVGLVGPRGDAGVRADGRVDITDGTRKYILYRTLAEGQEKWYVLDERFNPTPLDQGRLEAILLDLLS
jgi:hypothetical protein